MNAHDERLVHHDAYSFTQRVQAMSSNDPNEDCYGLKLAERLHERFAGEALNWYTYALNQHTRMNLQHNIELWCSAREEQFRFAPEVELTKLQALKYTVQDAREDRNPVDFVQIAVVLGNHLGIQSPEPSPAWEIYLLFDVNLRRSINAQQRLRQLLTSWTMFPKLRMGGMGEFILR